MLNSNYSFYCSLKKSFLPYFRNPLCSLLQRAEELPLCVAFLIFLDYVLLKDIDTKALQHPSSKDWSSEEMALEMFAKSCVFAEQPVKSWGGCHRLSQPSLRLQPGRKELL